MKKLMFAAAALLSASMLVAQEIAEDSAVQGYDGGVQALEEAQAMEEPLEGAESAADLLEKKMSEKGWESGWDSDKGRIIVTVSDEFVPGYGCEGLHSRHSLQCRWRLRFYASGS